MLRKLAYVAAVALLCASRVATAQQDPSIDENAANGVMPIENVEEDGVLPNNDIPDDGVLPIAEVAQCDQPAQPGMCEAYIPSWYFDSKTKRCKRFVYGGCGGNENRFNSAAACKAACQPAICKQLKEAGRCKGTFQRFYYDQATKKCTKFVFGGCKGNDNNFVNKAACETACKSPDTLQPKLCKLKAHPGMCLALIPSWYFDAKSGQCKEFVYGGCGGNANRFGTKAACEKKCKP